MIQVWLIATNTLRQVVRQRLFYNVALFGIGMVLFSMVVGNLTFGFPDRVVRSIGLSGVSIALNLMALLLSVGLVHDEIDRKTLFVVLTRRLHRAQYVFGRFTGLLLALAISLAGLTVIFAVTLLMARGSLGAADAVALFAALPEAACLAAVGIVLSCYTSPTIGTGVCLGVWIAAASTDDLLVLTKDDPLQHTLAQGLWYVLPALKRFDFRAAAVYVQSAEWSHALAAAAYGALYSAALVCLASLILTRREMV